jgi:hypothetical protein
VDYVSDSDRHQRQANDIPWPLVGAVLEESCIRDEARSPHRQLQAQPASAAQADHAFGEIWETPTGIVPFGINWTYAYPIRVRPEEAKVSCVISHHEDEWVLFQAKVRSAFYP